MNKNGKSNFIFIILIPIFLIFTIIFVDTLNSYTINKRFKIDTENIIREVMENDEIHYEEYYVVIK